MTLAPLVGRKHETGGILIERLRARLVMTIAFLAWSICTGVTGLANGLFMLALTRFAFGAGEAPGFPAANSFLAKWFPSRERRKTNSLMNAAAFLGPALGPVLLVPLIQRFSWRGACSWPPPSRPPRSFCWGSSGIRR
jgi:MFS transporter, ACS family, glucarate transporter